MCGIWGFIYNENLFLDHNYYYDYFMKLSHRGPDSSVFTKIDNVFIGFHRLAILETNFNGLQPYMIDNTVLITNGEIYNYKELIEEYNLDIKNDCDCLVLLHLYKKLSEDEFINVLKTKIKAEYAFIIFDFENNKLKKVIASRDHVGVRPLYYGTDKSNNIIFSSEVKAIPKDFYGIINEFPCGVLYINDVISKEIREIDYNTIYDVISSPTTDENFNELRESLILAVERRLIVDNNVEIGYYLSGGLDSSVICAIASKLQPNKKIRTFSIGFEGSTDLPFAKKVADYINSEHTEILITEEDALKAIDEVIYATCTYDITTIRASVGQFLISKYIHKNTNIKVIINGDGSDEVLGGYIFNYNAPNPEEFHECSKEFVKNIHLYDSRRLDRCLAYFSLEARVPFLDIDFIKSAWNIPAFMRMPSYKNMEKYCLRKAFEGYLPDDCLFRKKEAFSDGISSKDKSWYKTIETYINCEIRDDCPTKEASYYKNKFIEYFGKSRTNIIPKYWQPGFMKDEKYIDPSARVLDVY